MDNMYVDAILAQFCGASGERKMDFTTKTYKSRNVLFSQGEPWGINIVGYYRERLFCQKLYKRQYKNRIYREGGLPVCVKDLRGYSVDVSKRLCDRL